MDFDKIDSVTVYPPIGIARIGNSPSEYFVGPTIPGQPASDDSDFRDPEGRIKRQAAKFFVYALDAQGRILGELNTSHGVKIEWRVKVANKKAAWYNFDLALDIPAACGKYDLQGVPSPDGLPLLSQRRNQRYQDSERTRLMIEPSERCIEGRCTNEDGVGYQFDDGKIEDKVVNLGELRTDELGRLLFLGGHGESGSFNDSPLTTFANNEGWYDDTSDGSVDAVVTLPDARPLQAKGSWVLTAPPNFAVGVPAFSTGYDLLLDVAKRSGLEVDDCQPAFYRDIYPMLKHLTQNQWVNAGVQREFGWGSGYDFEHPQVIERCASASDAHRSFRQTIFESFRNPAFEKMEALAWPPLYGDAVTFNVDSTDPRNWFAVTKTQYENLRRWARGDFSRDAPPEAKACQAQSATDQANGLTEAALEGTLGGPFHPGCEFTWPMRNEIMYESAFRIKRRQTVKDDFGVAINNRIAMEKGGPLDGSAPGDITRWMAVPWQSDTSSCLSSYHAFSGEYLPTFWPARVPNDVLTEEQYKIVSDTEQNVDRRVETFSPSARKKWLRGYIYNAAGQVISDRMKGVEKFTKEWAKIGIVVKRQLDSPKGVLPNTVWVETGRESEQKERSAPDRYGTTESFSDRPAWVRANPRSLR